MRITATGCRARFVDGATISFEKRTRTLFDYKVTLFIFAKIFLADFVRHELQVIGEALDVTRLRCHDERTAAVGTFGTINFCCNFASDGLNNFVYD